MTERGMMAAVVVMLTACASGGVGGDAGGEVSRHPHAHLDAALNRVVAASDPVAEAAAAGLDVVDGRILVEVVAADAGEVEKLSAWLAEHGADDTRSWQDRVLSRVPPALLVDLAGRAGVTMVRRPSTASVAPAPPPAKGSR